MLMFTLSISHLTTSNLLVFMDLTFQVPMKYYSLQPWTLFSPPSHPQLGIVPALVQPVNSFWSSFALFSSSIFGTYWPGKFIFQCHILLPFHTVHRVLKARMLKWFAIAFSGGPCFVRTLHHDPSILGGPTWVGSSLCWFRQGCDLCDQWN